jgi:hypothetical protein
MAPGPQPLHYGRMLSTLCCWADRPSPNMLVFYVFVRVRPTPRQQNALGYGQVCGMTRYSIVPAGPMGKGHRRPGWHPGEDREPDTEPQ